MQAPTALRPQRYADPPRRPCAERPAAGLLAAGADAALTGGVRSLRLALDAAAAARALAASEWEQLAAFGTSRYAKQTLQASALPPPSFRR